MTFTITEINHGIASRIGDNIYINKKIKKYDMGLFMALLEHEEAHTSGYKWKDIKMDMVNDSIKNKKREYYGFILTHPSSWTEFLPIQRIDNRWICDPLMTLIMLMLLMLLIYALIGII